MTAAAPVLEDASSVLREFRRTRRRRVAGRAAYPVYVVTVVALLYGTTAAGPAMVALHRSRPDSRQLVHIVTAAPGVLTAVVTLLLVGILRTATWHGPVALSAADAQWLLPLPVDRAELLRHRAYRSLGVWLVGGAVLGAVVGFLLALVTTSEIAAPVAAGAGSGALLGLAMTGAGLLVQRSARVASGVIRATSLVVVLALADAVIGLATSAPGRIVWWTGPWGWAAVVLERAIAPDRAVLLAWALLAVLAVAGVLLTYRLAPYVPAERLRQGAGTTAAVGNALALGETREAAVQIATARTTTRYRWRLPVPSRQILIVPWRDAVALLRMPGRVGATVLLAGATAAVLAPAQHLHGATRAVLVVLGAVLALLAASRICEPARLDADDPARSSPLLVTFDRLALLHAIVPMVVLTALALIAALVSTRLANLPVGPGLLLAVCAAPVLVSAMLAAVFRGRAPLYLAFTGGDVAGAGAAGVPLLVLWFVAPAGIGIGLVAYGLLAHQTPVDAVLGAAVATLALLAWTRGRAASMVRVAEK